MAQHDDGRGRPTSDQRGAPPADAHGFEHEPVESMPRGATADEAEELGLLQELPRPAGMTDGRLRVIGYLPFTAPPVSIEELPLKVVTLENAIATPRTLANGRIGAIYAADGALVDASHRGKRGFGWAKNPKRLPREHADPDLVLKGTTYYAGHWGPVFGHLLLETLPRFWPELDYGQYDHLVFYPKRLETTTVGRRAHVTQLIGAAGPERAEYVLLSDHGARFERLTVASAPIHMKDAADRRFLEVFDRIAARLLAHHTPGGPLPKRVYLSRSHLDSSRKRIGTNEDEVEVAMEKLGFTIVHPQELPLPDQIALLQNAEVIAGCDGSALHMSAFARPGTKLLAIDARTVPNQFLVDQARGLDSVHVLAVGWAHWSAPSPAAKSSNVQRYGTWQIQVPKVLAALELLLG